MDTHFVSADPGGVVRGVLAATMAQFRPGHTPRMKRNFFGVLGPGPRFPPHRPKGLVSLRGEGGRESRRLLGVDSRSERYTVLCPDPLKLLFLAVSVRGGGGGPVTSRTGQPHPLCAPRKATSPALVRGSPGGGPGRGGHSDPGSAAQHCASGVGVVFSSWRWVCEACGSPSLSVWVREREAASTGV